MIKKIAILSCICFILNFINVSLSLSFTSKTRITIVNNAIIFCPKELKSYLLKNLEAVKSGAGFVDRNNRIYIKPYEIENFYFSLVENLKGDIQGDYNTAAKFGLIAGYVSEIINPCSKLYQIKIPQATGEEKVVIYDGYQNIADVKKQIDNMLKKYNFNSSTCNFDTSIIDQAYSEAVNEIVDYWISAWEASGHDIKFYKQDEMMKNNGSSSKNDNALLIALITDAIDILPDELAKELTPGDNIDSLLSSSPVKTSNYNLDLSVFLNQAKDIIQNFFPNVTDELILPDTIYYLDMSGGNINVQNSFLDINDKNDQYSLLLSTLLSLWIVDFKEINVDKLMMPREGIYLRDDNGTLYYYGEDDNQ